MENLVTDTFTVAVTQDLTSHAPDTGGAWVERLRTGTKKWRVDATNDRAFQDGPDSNFALINTVNVAPVSNNYDVSVTVRAISGGDTQPLLIIGRYVDNNNLYAAGKYRNEQTNDCKIWKKVGGVVTELASGDMAIVAGDVLKFKIRNGAKELHKNGVLISGMTTADNQITAIGEGGIGGGQVFVSGDDVGAWHVDDFKIDQEAWTSVTGMEVADGQLIINLYYTDEGNVIGGEYFNFEGVSYRLYLNDGVTAFEQDFTVEGSGTFACPIPLTAASLLVSSVNL